MRSTTHAVGSRSSTVAVIATTVAHRKSPSVPSRLLQLQVLQTKPRSEGRQSTSARTTGSDGAELNPPISHGTKHVYDLPRYAQKQQVASLSSSAAAAAAVNHGGLCATDCSQPRSNSLQHSKPYGPVFDRAMNAAASTKKTGVLVASTCPTSSNNTKSNGRTDNSWRTAEGGGQLSGEQCI